jgi:mannosyl-oligosaccharide alpha-1,2-mannosidase
MPLSKNRRIIYIFALFSILFCLYVYNNYSISIGEEVPKINLEDNYFWAQLPERYPVQAPVAVPPPIPGSIPTIQHNFPAEESSTRNIREGRLDAVKGNFTHAWNGYRKYAWMSDEVAPISGQAHNPFGGWAATLVDTLGSQACHNLPWFYETNV